MPVPETNLNGEVLLPPAAAQASGCEATHKITESSARSYFGQAPTWSTPVPCEAASHSFPYVIISQPQTGE